MCLPNKALIETIDLIINDTHYTLFSYASFCHLRPQKTKARRSGRSGKVTTVTTDDIVK